MKVEAIKHTNVFEKTVHYVKISTEGQEPVYIQVGEKNYEAVKKLTENIPQDGKAHNNKAGS